MRIECLYVLKDEQTPVERWSSADGQTRIPLEGKPAYACLVEMLEGCATFAERDVILAGSFEVLG